MCYQQASLLAKIASDKLASHGVAQTVHMAAGPWGQIAEVYSVIVTCFKNSYFVVLEVCLPPASVTKYLSWRKNSWRERDTASSGLPEVTNVSCESARQSCCAIHIDDDA